VLSLEYIAGIWDSDGSISISKSKNHGFPSYRISCQLTWLKFDHSEKVINEIKERFGGSIFEESREKTNFGKYKNKYIAFKSDTLNAKSLLEAIEPYLVLKKEQAKTSLKLQNLKKPRGYHGREKGYTKEEKIIFGELHEKCKMLNKQGKVI